MKTTATATALALSVLLSFAPAAFAGEGEHCKTSAAKHAKHEKHEKQAKMAAKGWLGVETAKDEATGAYRITEVAAGSPAEQAGFRPGDVLVAFNGIPVKDKDRVKAAKASIGVGSQVTYTVARAGGEHRLTATLAPVPEQVLAKWLADSEKNEAAAQVASAN